jgi:hypothetical protein
MKFPAILASGDELFYFILKFAAVVIAIVVFGYVASALAIVCALNDPKGESKAGLALAMLGFVAGAGALVFVATTDDIGFVFGTLCVLPLPLSIVGLALSLRPRKRPNQSPEPTAMSVTPPAAQEPRQP